MKKILVLLFLTFILSGCATYRFQKSGTSGNQGYLVSYDGKPILEYTLGKDKSLPDLTLAKERFKRRRPAVEYYYKKMGQMETRFREYLWEPPAMLVDLVGGIFRWPFMAVADYRYNRNSKYRERVDKLDEQRDVLEKARINSFREKLDAYINEDLTKESLPQAHLVAVGPKLLPKLETPPVQKTVPQSAAPLVVTKEEAVAVESQLPAPVAVIIANPMKGNSPLKVNFSGQKSYSQSGKIVSYDWDFGDGDTSAKKNTENTYWSTTYGSRKFTVSLIVRDEKGITANTTAIIEVITK